jgi:hypothetical protein
LIYGRQRRARKLNADGGHTFQDVKVIGDLQEWRYYYCNTDVAASYHVDHMIPLVRGGSDWPANLVVVACPTCNISKGAKTAEEYLGFLRDRDVQDLGASFQALTGQPRAHDHANSVEGPLIRGPFA